jgi:hypothetical protein
MLSASFSGDFITRFVDDTMWSVTPGRFANPSMRAAGAGPNCGTGLAYSLKNHLLSVVKRATVKGALGPMEIYDLRFYDL